jgi:hypothetical protein
MLTIEVQLLSTGPSSLTPTFSLALLLRAAFTPIMARLHPSLVGHRRLWFGAANLAFFFNKPQLEYKENLLHFQT